MKSARSFALLVFLMIATAVAAECAAPRGVPGKKGPAAPSPRATSFRPKKLPRHRDPQLLRTAVPQAGGRSVGAGLVRLGTPQDPNGG